MKKKPSPKKRKKTSKKQNNCCFLKKDLGIVVKIALFLSIILIFWAVYVVKADQKSSPIVYIQDFESSVINSAGGPPNNYDWFLFNSSADEVAITQVQGSNKGILASSGDYYGVVSKESSYSNFGDCSPDGPSDRWLTQIDIFLDTNWTLGAGFDYSIETRTVSPEGDDLRYSIFHVTKDTSTKKLLIGISDEINYEPREDLEDHNYFQVKKSGWFTLRSILRSVGNSLVIDMLVLDDSKRVVWQEFLTADDFSYNAVSLYWNCRADFPVLYNGYTINNPDLPAENSGFDLAIDNHKLVLYKDLDVVGPPLTKDECLDDGWRIFDWQTFSESTFKSQGDCVSYIESSVNADGNSDF